MNARKQFSVSNLSDFIQKEVKHEDSSIQRIVEGEPDKAIVSGDVLGPLTQVGREGRSLLCRGQKLFYSRFRSGDHIDIGIVSPVTGKFKILMGSSISIIRFPAPGVIEVLLKCDLISTDVKEIFLLPKSYSGIKSHLRQKLDDLESIGFKAPHSRIDNSIVRENFENISERLNATQKDALRFLTENDFRGLIQGPPGTGKTHLLVALLRLAVESGLRVGLAALSHAAVDNALARIIRSGVEESRVVRIAGKKEAIKKEPYEGYDIYSLMSPSFKEAGEDFSLFAATMHSWCMSSTPAEIDLLIIDEGSQVPIYFHPFLEKLSSRVIMFGDHNQLPPVIQISTHELPAEDIFSYEISLRNFPMLEIQYRMNERVQQWSSNRFYRGRLRPDDSNRNRDLLANLASPSGLLGNHSVNLVSHEGTASNNANPFEASKVADLVSAIKREGSIPLKEIGIVTPHRAQAGAVCAALQEKLGLGDAQSLLVDTVERFQGQEREAMILSMGAESDGARRGERSFLGDGRRLNVAVTRARSRFYCLAPKKLVDSTDGLAYESHLKSFFDWCGKKP